jgi:hypothetical protein
MDYVETGSRIQAPGVRLRALGTTKAAAARCLLLLGNFKEYER